MLKRSTDVADLQAALATARARIAELEAERFAAQRTDPLTGLHAAGAFRDAVGRELERSRRSGAPLALALYDVDERLELDAAAGPGSGDAALAALARVIAEGNRAHDVVGRTGPGELAVLLTECEAAEAIPVASRAVTALTDREVPGAGHVTASGGVVPWTRGMSFEALLAGAAGYLAAARTTGGGRVHGPPAPQADAHRHADVIEALSQALTERDRYTGEHSEFVVALSQGVATHLGLPDAEVGRIGTAARLHDIGKVAIPDSILHKPAKLTEEEWVLMREHPVIGERILRAIPGLGGVARIVRHEHERWDGGGYPDGLRGEAIPVGSRIILACDTYHAMTSDRPYRTRRPHAEAIAELARCAGTQFDPRVTEALIGQLWGARQGASA